MYKIAFFIENEHNDNLLAYYKSTLNYNLVACYFVENQ